MYQSVNLHEFRDAFRIYDRTENFSYEGLELIYNWIEEVEESTGEQIQLDVIAFCCDFVEADLEEINQNFDKSFESLDDAWSWLLYETEVLGKTDNSIVYQAF